MGRVRDCQPKANQGDKSSYAPSVEVVFGGGLWPLGQTIGFVELELTRAIEAYRTWTRGWWPPRPLFKRLPEARLVDQLTGGPY